MNRMMNNEKNDTTRLTDTSSTRWSRNLDRVDARWMNQLIDGLLDVLEQHKDAHHLDATAGGAWHNRQ